MVVGTWPSLCTGWRKPLGWQTSLALVAQGPKALPSSFRSAHVVNLELELRAHKLVQTRRSEAARLASAPLSITISGEQPPDSVLVREAWHEFVIRTCCGEAEREPTGVEDRLGVRGCRREQASKQEGVVCQASMRRSGGHEWHWRSSRSVGGALWMKKGETCCRLLEQGRRHQTTFYLSCKHPLLTRTLFNACMQSYDLKKCTARSPKTTTAPAS
eukprot:1161848-Pelagomonas_calceolata.AAC.9